MTSFFDGLFNLSKIILAGGLKRLLMGAGFGVFTGTIFLSVFNYFLSILIGEFGNLGEYVGLLGIMGLGKAISVIIGAYVVRLTILSTMKFSIGKM
nr:DUF2523 family protein [uncultured Moraxella sp.]